MSIPNCSAPVENATDPSSPVPVLAAETIYPHLMSEAARLIDASVYEKCRHILKDRCIYYPRFQCALDLINDIMGRPNGVRPGCLAVLGPANAGKSTLALAVQKEHGKPAGVFSLGNGGSHPLLVVEMPTRSTEPRICLAMARAMGLAGYGTSRSRVVSDNVFRGLEAQQVKMVIFNEAQHLDHLNSLERRIALDLIKSITNHAINVVLIGTESLEAALGQDPQITSRMRVFRMMPLSRGKELQNFVSALESCFPLPEQSNLADPKLSEFIYERTTGMVGDVVEFCNTAAIYAVRNGRSCIDIEVLRNTSVLPRVNEAGHGPAS